MAQFRPVVSLPVDLPGLPDSQPLSRLHAMASVHAFRPGHAPNHALMPTGQMPKIGLTFDSPALGIATHGISYIC